MATVSQTIAYNTVVDLTAGGSWSDGDDFRMEAQGGEVRLHEAASAPTIANGPAYIRLVAGDVYFHAQNASDNLYAWTINRNGAQVVVNDAE